jgi:hypothetical protein
VLLIGQDESIFHQFLFSKMGWVGAKGESVLRPKSEGEGYMISAFVSRLWGFNEILSNMVLTDEVLEKVNARRKGKHYVSTEAAEEVYGRTLKEDIIDYSPLVHLFEYGAEKKGYWNYNHMALQVEDLMDCLPVLYPDFDFVLLFDQSSGHGKSQKGGLYASNMGKSWGGTQPIMRPSELTEGGCLGPFGARMIIGDVQEMNFQRIENGLFYMDNTEREERRDDKPVPNMTEKSKRKKVDILKDLRVKTGLLYRGFLSVDEVHKLASDHNVPIEVVKQKIEPGWVDKPKGLLQVLWERGWIDESNLSKYSKEGKAAWFDQKTKEVKPEFESEYKKYSLTYLMSQCPDFKRELSAMEKLVEDLSSGEAFTVTILVTPKYHCELAGEGIEYDWGLSKRNYRSLPHASKKGKVNFLESLIQSLKKVNVEHRRKFSAKARRYMLTYKLFDSSTTVEECEHRGFTYADIEKHVNTLFKAHRCSFDQEYGYISKIWRESLVGNTANI